MPANLAVAAVTPSSTVLPLSLSTSFVESNAYPILAIPVTSYKDGTFERSLIQDGVNPPRSTRTWRLSKRLTTAQLSALRTFWESTVLGGLKPFYFYDPFDPGVGQAIGSNYDATGVSTQGRVTVFFRGNWGEQTQLGRSVVPELQLIEVA